MYELDQIFEAILYQKVQERLDAVRLYEAASLLAESDPKPRVEKSRTGEPIPPSAEQFNQYFAAMQAEHIKIQFENAKARWAEASAHEPDNPQDQAEWEALQTEVEVAKKVLKLKEAADQYGTSSSYFGPSKLTQAQKRKRAQIVKKKKRLSTNLNKVVKGFTRRSPLLRKIALGVSSNMINRRYGSQSLPSPQG